MGTELVSCQANGQESAICVTVYFMRPTCKPLWTSSRIPVGENGCVLNSVRITQSSCRQTDPTKTTNQHVVSQKTKRYARVVTTTFYTTRSVWFQGQIPGSGWGGWGG